MYRLNTFFTLFLDQVNIDFSFAIANGYSVNDLSSAVSDAPDIFVTSVMRLVVNRLMILVVFVPFMSKKII